MGKQSEKDSGADASEKLRAAVVEAYREELEHRYDPENVRRFEDFKRLRPEIVDDLRNFFLDYIYPPYENRGARDSSFDEMGNVIKSPRKLWPLFGTALTSVWKLGGRIGQALQAGMRTLEAYIESKRLEERMIEAAHNMNLHGSDEFNSHVIAELVRTIPEKKVRRFQKDMVLLFQSLANVKLLETTLEIMSDSRKIMDERVDVYTETERAGLGYGYELLSAGFALFRSMDDAEIETVIRGIETVEKDWYRTVMHRP